MVRKEFSLIVERMFYIDHSGQRYPIFRFRTLRKVIEHILRNKQVSKWLVLSSDGRVNNHLLNVLGIQIIRIVLARFLLIIRRRILLHGVRLDNEARLLIEDGLVVISNFLPKSDFEALKEEHKRIIENGNDRIERENYESKTVAVEADDPKPRALSIIAQNPRLLFLLQVGEGRSKIFMDQWQYETTSASKEGVDNPVARLHSDVFHSMHKAFLYLSDVDIEHGPFTYCRKTNQITWKRLVREYVLSCDKKASSRGFGWKPEKWEQEYLGLTEEPIIGLANTLIIADTKGLHKRGRSEKERLSVHLKTRHHPFRFSSQPV